MDREDIVSVDPLEEFASSDDVILIKGPDEIKSTLPRKRKQRSEHIAILLYPDNPDHEKALIRVHKYFQFTYILHDKDTFEKEEDELQKKPHYHVLLHFSSQKTPSRIADILQIEDRFVQCVTNRDSYLRYMLHVDEPDKFRYDVSEVVSSRRNLIYDALRRARSRSERAEEIIRIIQNKNYKSYDQLLLLLIHEGYYEECSRISSWIRMIYSDVMTRSGFDPVSGRQISFIK